MWAAVHAPLPVRGGATGGSMIADATSLNGISVP
jgi:hypothetical protein